MGTGQPIRGTGGARRAQPLTVRAGQAAGDARARAGHQGQHQARVEREPARPGAAGAGGACGGDPERGPLSRRQRAWPALAARAPPRRRDRAGHARQRLERHPRAAGRGIPRAGRRSRPLAIRVRGLPGRGAGLRRDGAGRARMARRPRAAARPRPCGACRGRRAADPHDVHRESEQPDRHLAGRRASSMRCCARCRPT